MWPKRCLDESIRGVRGLRQTGVRNEMYECEVCTGYPYCMIKISQTHSQKDRYSFDSTTVSSLTLERTSTCLIQRISKHESPWSKDRRDFCIWYFSWTFKNRSWVIVTTTESLFIDIHSIPTVSAKVRHFICYVLVHRQASRVPTYAICGGSWGSCCCPYLRDSIAY